MVYDYMCNKLYFFPKFSSLKYALRLRTHVNHGNVYAYIGYGDGEI